ncbi:MAG: hypothetical protein ACD_76C00016G0002 [uncultured bacterium]|nr:MAG: hypothetical protein ACD_76C00016G0002 [uncultured bacterium]HBD05314.1 tryptophan--tRNA ligase [Candidatus Uhrbacteria bacterium]
MKRLFSAIQPSGILHIGNYIGAMHQFVNMQKEHDAIFCVVDYHSITVPQEPKALRQNILNLAAMYLACGVDPSHAILFQQSRVSEHTELAWIFQTIARMSELERMTQYKDKALVRKQNVSAGLFAYPCLMAADILLYDTDVVPVGEDQKQHVELARDIAERFNKQFGPVFKLPEVKIKKEGARIMGLDDPLKKMSKSSENPKSYIALTDDDASIEKKIRSAVTDSGTEIVYSKDRPAISNLMTIMSSVTGKNIKQIESEFNKKGYKEFKDALAKDVINFVSPIRSKYEKLIQDEAVIIKILDNGAKKAKSIAEKKMAQIKKAIGVAV